MLCFQGPSSSQPDQRCGVLWYKYDITGTCSGPAYTDPKHANNRCRLVHDSSLASYLAYDTGTWLLKVLAFIATHAQQSSSAGYALP